MGLGSLWFVVAFGPCQPVGDGQPKGQCDVEQQSSEKDDLKDLHDVVGAHEVAESVVPCTAVVTQNAEIGAGMKQQEETQESAQQRYQDLLRNRMDFWKVHIGIVFAHKSIGFSGDGQMKITIFVSDSNYMSKPSKP